MPEESGFGEKALSQVVEMGLSSQLETAEEINVDVKADLLQAMQGQINGVRSRVKG
ncbi:MAG: hypothetical protein HC881_19505 [Leptolyngbyaceae cyanobacterium SL_7_1]|nr:hypothetical protein [Leptolyngbyaceae cyanobacterium SL_7_1]